MPTATDWEQRSTRFPLRLPADLAEMVRADAERDLSSINSVIVRTLRKVYMPERPEQPEPEARAS